MFDFLDKLKYYGNRYLLPTVFLVAGLILLKMALVPEMKELNNGEIIPVTQNSGFLYASILFLVAGVIWFLYLFGIIRSAIGYVVMLIMAVASAVLIYFDYTVIEEQVTYDTAYEMRDLDIKARMGDLKAAELAYKEMNGVYTNSMDDLINFVYNGKKMKILKKGSIPERKISPEERDYLYGDNRPIDKLMTEIEAKALSVSPLAGPDLNGFVRDTNYIPVMDAIFNDEKYITNREKIGASFGFNADSLRYVPFTKELVTLDTSWITKGEGESQMWVPTLYIEMLHPMKNDKDEQVAYSIGAIEDNHLRESWKDE